MKKLLFILSLCLLPIAAQAKEYKGTLYVGESLILENTRVELVITKNNTATLKLYKVKFSKWMPVRVNIEIHNVNCDNGSLKLDHGTPTMNGKPYPLLHYETRQEPGALQESSRIKNRKVPE